MRLFENEDGVASFTPPVGCAHVMINEFDEAFIKQLVILETYQGNQWLPSAYEALKNIGAKFVVYTMLVNGKKKTVRMAIKENCDANDLKRLKIMRQYYNGCVWIWSWQGTSFASPICAGIAVLMIATYPAITNAQVKAL